MIFLAKTNHAACKLEMDKLQGLVQELRTELQDIKTKNEEFTTVVQGIIEPNSKSRAGDSTVISSYQSMKTQQKMLGTNNTYLKGHVVIKVREELQALKKENEQLKLGSAASHKVCRILDRGNITILSDANDLQTGKLERFVQKQRDDKAAQRDDKDTKKAILRAFGWEKSTADPNLV